MKLREVGKGRFVVERVGCPSVRMEWFVGVDLSSLLCHVHAVGVR